MPRARLQFTVHAFATALLAATVVVLVLLLVGVAQQRLSRVAEDSAQNIFDGMADANAGKLRELIGTARDLVRVDAALDAAAYAGGAGGRTLQAAMLAAVEHHDALYGLYFGLADGSFEQVIDLRRRPGVAATLSAPAGSVFALRTIRPDGGLRREHWRFLGGDHRLLGTREQPTDYDPTRRPWYLLAHAASGTVVSAPYLFQSSGQPGITVARRIAALSGVVGADLSLETLGDFIASVMQDHPGGAAILDPEDRVLAYAGSPAVMAGGAIPPLTPLARAGNPHFRMLADPAVLRGPSGRTLRIAGTEHVLAVRSVRIAPDIRYRIVTFAPLDAFDAAVRQARRDMALTGALVLLVCLPLAYWGGRRIAIPLEGLARDAERVEKMDFAGVVHSSSRIREIALLGRAYHTMKQSIRARTAALELATAKLQSLVDIGLGLSALSGRRNLLQRIVDSGERLSGANAAALFVRAGEDRLHLALQGHAAGQENADILLRGPQGDASDSRDAAARAALERRTVRIDAVGTEAAAPVTGAGACRIRAVLAVPLLATDGEVLGVLQLMHVADPDGGEAHAFPASLEPFVEALAAQAALALENDRLLRDQHAMLDGVIRLIAGAIDAKSSYTGGHCERVPELAQMLAEAACASTEGPLADFDFPDEDAWRAFRIGAWLHDCGKVTTPEYVVDKATKLETLYNRIHEVRTRFEVLWRDTEIARLQARLDGADPAAADAACAARQAVLREEFAFLATCNLGSENMSEADVARVRALAGQTWVRHFDDRLGLSAGELQRYPPVAASLPAQETLLADHPWQRVPREESAAYAAHFGFDMEVPPLLYDFGEVHNLSIRHGTLTPEERFKINEHVIQTIVMLDRLPLPRAMARIPEYAGTHHEALDGSGYPRRLDRGALSIPARIMAIADVFEALTASDRPYKRAKSLSESLHILAGFVARGHLDAALYALFLESGTYLRYARRYLRPEQIDAVDVAACLAAARPAT